MNDDPSQETTMREHDVRFDSAGATLAGTVCRPLDPREDARVAARPCPAVLLVTGCGPMDCDGSHPRLRLDVSRQLAHALAQRGVASLR
jgi:hypothetical protein